MNEICDEEAFNPNDDAPDETSDEELFNPNDEVPDETPDEELFNPNDDVSEDTSDEELFNPNDETPDETPDEGLSNPNDDVPDDKSDENYNPSSSGQITITEQEHENEPETEPESDPKEDTEKDIEYISPEGEPMGPADSKESMDIRADLESWGYEPEYDPDIEAEVEDQTHENEAEGEQENDSESEQESESKHPTEKESESEPDLKPEVFELVTPEGEPIAHPQEAPPELIPLEAAIEQLYEEQQSAEEEKENENENENEPNEISEQEPEILSDQESKFNSEQESEVKSEQKSDMILDQKPELMSQQKQEQKQKSKRIKAKSLELITDPKELDDYKHNERQHIVGIKYDVIFREKQFKKSEEKPKSKKEKPEKVKELELITDSREPCENTKRERSEIEKISEKSESKSEKASKGVQNRDSGKLKNLELTTEPNRKENKEQINESKLENSSKSQNTSKKELNKIEIVNSELQKQNHSSGEAKNRSESETVSKDSLDLREKYRQETGKRPIYNQKETKGFLSWLEKQKKLDIKKKLEKQEEKIVETKEEWQILLEKWVWEARNSKISKEIKKELIDIIRKYRKFRELYLRLIKLLEKRNLTKEEDDTVEKMFKELEQISRIQTSIFRNLRAFRSLYNQYHIWDINRILKEREKFINYIIQKLQNLKKDIIIPQAIRKSWKEFLNENLHRIITLSFNQKSQIVKIIQKEKLEVEDKKKLVAILKKLPIEDLISLLGKDFEKHSKNYVKWGWDFYEFIKKDMLTSYINKPKNLKLGKGIYDRLEERVIIEPSILRKVCDQIKAKYPNKNLPDYILSKIIGGHKNTISNALAGSTIPQRIFKRLEKMFGKPIPHKTTIPIGKMIELEENEETAEFIAIMLGDGHFNEKSYSIVITLNGIDEYPYTRYVKDFMRRILQNEPEENWAKDDNDPKKIKGLKLRVYSLAVVEALKKVGLVPGNKVKHQVSIPEKFKKFVKTCLKGLIDTDGSIYIQKNDKSFVITFVNGSKNLVEDFKQLCSKLNIKTSKVNHYLRKADNKYVYSVSIGSKEMVKLFLTQVDSEKWKDKNRRKFWGIQLIYLNTSEDIRKSIEKQIELDYPDPTKRKFSIKFLKYLENLSKKHGLDINLQDTENAILNALNYERNKYSIELGKTLRRLFIEIGSIETIKEKFNGISIDKKSIKKYLIQLFSEKEFQGYSFNRWYRYNQNLYMKKNGKLQRFGKKQRKSICRRIFKIMNKKPSISNKTVLEELKKIINSEELRGKTQGIRILKFERLSYLLNHPKYRRELEDILMRHIKFIRAITNYKKLNEKIFKVELFNVFGFLGNRNLMMELIRDLENKFNENFDIFLKNNNRF